MLRGEGGRMMRILSLSGGGFQGLFTTLLLARLEEEERAPLRERFDAFAGTSVGGIIASAASVGMPMSDLARVFEREGVRIFSDRPAPSNSAAVARDFVRFVGRSKYDGSHLARIVRSYCGDMRMGDLDRPLLLPAVRLADGAPVLFTPQSHPETLLREAVMATSAAPMIFPAAMVGGALHADGALFANCPDSLALDYAKYALGARSSDVRMLGVGAMNQSPPLSEPESPNLGALGWMMENRIFRTLISCQAMMTKQEVKRELDERYQRVDADPDAAGRQHVGLDVADQRARAAIRSVAEACWPRLRDAANLLDCFRNPDPSEEHPDRS